MSSSKPWEKIYISNSAKYIYTIVKCVSPHAANIFAVLQGANVFVAIEAGTGKALRDALGGTRGGEQGQN